ncbi:hypothetical protein RUND412_007888 [Rhizina undulata]
MDSTARTAKVEAHQWTSPLWWQQWTNEFAQSAKQVLDEIGQSSLQEYQQQAEESDADGEGDEYPSDDFDCVVPAPTAEGTGASARGGPETSLIDKPAVLVGGGSAGVYSDVGRWIWEGVGRSRKEGHNSDEYCEDGYVQGEGEEEDDHSESLVERVLVSYKDYGLRLGQLLFGPDTSGNVFDGDASADDDHDGDDHDHDNHDNHDHDHDNDDGKDHDSPHKRHNLNPKDQEIGNDLDMSGDATSSQLREHRRPSRSTHVDEDPAERERRREERRRRREEERPKEQEQLEAARQNLKERERRHKEKKDSSKRSELSVLSVIKSKGKEKERGRKPSVVEEMLTGIVRRTSVKVVEVQPREVRSKSSPEKCNPVLKPGEDSASKSPKPQTERRHHPHNDHSTPQARAECRRCIRKREKKEREQQILEGDAAAEREHRPEREHRQEREHRSEREHHHRHREKAVDVDDKKHKLASGSTIGNKDNMKPEKLTQHRVECVTCMTDDIPAKDAAKLNCGHHFCPDCLKRIFTLSLTDPAHMPPRCCTEEHIPLKHVNKLLPYETKKLWNKKYIEFTTANRLYCPTTDCGEWIHPRDIVDDIGRCGRCRAKVCALCNGKAHPNGECPKDEELQKFIETAKKNKFQRCYSCRAMVELEKGCNHMTCRCTAEFCYVCGDKWKTCECPWFNYDPDDEEYVVPVWNAENPPPPELTPELRARRERRARLREEQLREDEELARRLQRDASNDSDSDEEERRPYYMPLPLQIDPLAALGTIGTGLRNGFRRLAAEYGQPVITEHPREFDELAPIPRIERRRTEPANTGSRYRAEDRDRRPRHTPPEPDHEYHHHEVPIQVAESTISTHRSYRDPLIPQSRYLTNAQQVHIENYLRGLDLPNLELDPSATTARRSSREREERTRELRVHEPPPPVSTVGSTTGMGLRRSNTERGISTVRRAPRDFATEFELYRPRGGGYGGGSEVSGRPRRGSMSQMGWDAMQQQRAILRTDRRV